MGVLWNAISEKSSGGTELLCRRLEAGLSPELLDEVQIVPSRLHGELDPTKIRILYLHDLPNDPESQKLLANEGWKKFHKIVCVSNWQMQGYASTYRIPWSHFVVIPNSIEPIQRDPRPSDTKRFIYHTTPHRGLDILYAVIDKLHSEGERVFLDVYSSFKAYGWDDNDKPYEELFEKIRSHPAMGYHGFQPNEVIREQLPLHDCFAYPCVWPETSCLALIEAMSAGLTCIHPNYGALYETAGNWTMMYQYQEDKNQHAGVLYNVIRGYLSTPSEHVETQILNQKGYVDIFYNWNHRRIQWEELIKTLLPLPREMPTAMWTYKP
jgi:glycosyltransferase involved in cell wall biosynthesis